MFDIDNLKEIWETITRNKARSLMTAFGVFWGIFILVVLAGLGNGVKNGLMSQIEGFSTNTAFIFTGQTSMPFKGYQKGRQWQMENNDLSLLKQNIKEIKYISPMIGSYSSDNDNVFYQSKSGKYTVKGCMPEYNEIDRNKVIEGRFINEMDIRTERKVCVIGKKIREELFSADDDPIGKMIKANGIYFQIIGVIQSYNENVSVGDKNSNCVILPFNTMQKAYNNGDKFDFLAITAGDDDDVKVLETKVIDILKLQHDIHPDDNRAINSINFAEQFNMFKYLFIGLGILIWLVGIGTLLSGVIGVSNIMLVTVRERTREIGIRRALGAKPRSIITQIISESLLLTTLAGSIGLIFGTAVMSVVGNIFANKPQGQGLPILNPQMDFNAALIALIIIIISGILAGLLPASRAMQIKAIDAIRDE